MCRSHSGRWAAGLVCCLLASGAAAAQAGSDAATRVLPGAMATGAANSRSPGEEVMELRGHDAYTDYVVELTLADESAAEQARALGLLDGRPGTEQYVISDELLDRLRRAGFEVRVLGGVTIHRFSLDGVVDGRPPAAPDTAETAARSATVQATPGSFLISSGVVDDPIPDDGWAWRWVQVGAGSEAPPGSVTTNLEYRLRLHNDPSPADFFCADYEIYLSSETRGGAVPEHLIYENLGDWGTGSDGNFDDDVADDWDIYLNWRATGYFNGEDPNQKWYVYVIDEWTPDSGYLGYIEFTVYWEAPGDADLVATDVLFRDQPANGGSVVTNPLPGQDVYPHFYYTVFTASDLTGKIWTIDLPLSATPLCSYTGTVTAGNRVGYCTSPWTATAGAHDLRGTLDPDDVFSEPDEGNNVAVRSYTIGGCVPDAFEPDDGSAQASTLVAGSPQSHSICPVGDEDWAVFTLAAASEVVLETSGPTGDTRMWLYDDGLSQIEFNDDGGSGLFSRIDRLCGVDELAAGTYYVKINEYSSADTIDDYTLSLTATGCGGPPDIRVEPLTLDFVAGAPLTARSPASVAPETIADLEAKALLAGTVRVIVGLDVPFVEEGRLADPAAVERQRGRIAAAQQAVLRGLEGYDVEVLALYRFVNYMALEVDAAALLRLADLPQTTTLEEDVPEPPAMASSNLVIGSDVAWAAGFAGSGQVVAVLDTGVDKTHPFFSTGGNKVVSEACYSTNSAASASVCPGGVTESTAPGSGVNCPGTVDGCDHGTHVAGSVAGNDGTGPNFGVAREAELIAVQVFSRFDSPADCGASPAPCARAYVSDQIKGLERVYDLRTSFSIAAANMSLGGGQYFDTASCDAANTSRKAAIDTLRSVAIATVATSGNSGYKTSMGAPGCISTSISVGATTDADVVASFSNVASFLDLLAPGVSITSSVPGGGTATWQGTSMAAPHVSGAWAILKQKLPAATVDQVLAALRNTGTSVDDTRSGGSVTDMRRINVDLALDDLGGDAAEVFTIYNDGSALLAVTSMELDSAASWISWSPTAPFDVAAGGSRQVTVTVDFDLAPPGLSTRRLLVASDDPDESPYPGGVFINVDTAPTPCYPLTLGHTGQGADPTPSPANSPGCAAGEFREGALVTLTALPDPGWMVGGWSGTDDDASTATVNTVTMPAAAHLAEVQYVPAPCYSLTLGHTGMGADPTPDPDSSPGCAVGEYSPGELVTLTAAPDPGWVVGGWSGTDDDASTASVNTVTMPAADHTAGVDYVEVVCYGLTLDHTGSGADPTASPPSSPGCAAGTYLPGDAIGLKAAPTSGWRVGGWSGTSYDSSGATTNIMIMPGAASTASVAYTTLETGYWTSGGPEGGTLHQMVRARSDADVLFAAVSVGIYQSADDGGLWARTGFPDLTARSLAVSSNDLSLLFAGTDDGIYKSTDGGRTWVAKGLAGARVNAIAIHPTDPRIVLAGTGWRFQTSGGEIAALFRSPDGGDTWVEVLSGVDAIGTILVDTQDASIVYAGGYPGGTDDDGFFKSTDGGLSWVASHIASDTWNSEEAVALAMTETGAPPVLYAMTWGGIDEDVYKSTDRGATWSATGAPWISSAAPWSLAVAPDDPDLVWASTHYFAGSVYKSTNGGGSWQVLSAGPEDAASSLLIDPRDLDHLSLAFPGAGVYQSTDAGASWSATADGLSAGAITDVDVHPTASDTVLAAVSDGFLAESADAGAAWSDLAAGPFAALAVAYDPSNPATIWAGEEIRSTTSLSVFKSTDAGATWTEITFLTISGGTARVGVTDLWVDPSDSDVVLVAVGGSVTSAAGVYRTTNGGGSWGKTGPPIWTTTLAGDPNVPGVVYHGTRDCGYVYRSTNSGATWGEITGSPCFDDVTDIAVDASSDVYVTTETSLHHWDGAVLSEIPGLPSGPRTVTVDTSAAPGDVYVGTAADGVLKLSAGGVWSPFNAGLGNLDIYELIASPSAPRLLYAGTAGGGVWSARLGPAPPPCWPLTLSHTGQGADPVPDIASSPGCGPGEYLSGELVTLTAAPDPGWTVEGWSGTDDDASTSTVNTVTMPAAAHAAEVRYVEMTGVPDYLWLENEVLSGSEVYEACVSITAGPAVQVLTGATITLRSPLVVLESDCMIEASASVTIDNSKPTGCP